MKRRAFITLLGGAGSVLAARGARAARRLPPHARPPTRFGAPARSVAGGESRAQSGLSVHSSAPSAFLAPMLSRSRSVVERSAPMPFSSCTVERNPRVERGSFNIVRSLLFWLHSRSAVSIHILPGSTAKTLSEVLPVRRRDNLSCQINLQ